ncbi:MAG TPA: hypothetical protein VKA34_03170 [Balneolales bacterium]|nr:hypothetical protein [Balneolales bacterium]
MKIKIFGKKTSEMTDKELDDHITTQKTVCILIIVLSLLSFGEVFVFSLLRHSFTAGVSFFATLVLLADIVTLLSWKWAVDEKRFRRLER